MVGRTIGKYRILEQIGRGGMGTVYKAVDETLDRTVAIKVLNADALDQEAVERFRREAMMLARLSHPRIGAIHELTRDGHDLLMVMEFVSGETFEALVDRSGTVTLADATRLCMQVLEGLQYAHAAGVVHRDLKPANLIVMPNGDVKIMDFGIARMQGSEHLTSVGFMVGTPAYMSPEQVRGEEVDPRMDLYSVAVVFYRLLTHHLPFHGDTAVAMIHSQLNNPPTPPRQFRADLPDWTVAALTRGLAKGRGDRFQTAQEFRAALEGGINGTLPIAAILGPAGAAAAPAVPPAPAPSGGTGREPAPSAVAPNTSAPTAGTATATAGSSMASAAQVPRPPTARREAATVTLRAPHLATAGVLVGILVAGIAVLAFVALRRPTVVTQPPEVSAPAPAAAAASTTASTAPAQATAPAAVDASLQAQLQTQSPLPSQPTPQPETPSLPSSAPSTTAAQEPARGRTTSATATTAAGPTSPGPAGGTGNSATAPAVPADHFTDVRTLIVDGTRSREVDALLSLESATLVVRARGDASVLRTLPYPSIKAATYARARRPRGQKIPGAFDVPENFGGSGFLGSARHWITLQTPDEFLILRVEERTVARLSTALESRTGVKVVRAASD